MHGCLGHCWILLILAQEVSALQVGLVPRTVIERCRSVDLSAAREIPPPHDNCGLCAVCVGLDEAQTAKLEAEAAAAKKKWEEWEREAQQKRKDRKPAAPLFSSGHLLQKLPHAKPAVRKGAISESKVTAKTKKDSVVPTGTGVGHAPPPSSPWAVFRR